MYNEQFNTQILVFWDNIRVSIKIRAKKQGRREVSNIGRENYLNPGILVGQKGFFTIII